MTDGQGRYVLNRRLEWASRKARVPMGQAEGMVLRVLAWGLRDPETTTEEEGAGLWYEFTERPAQNFPIFRTSTAYHKKDCPVRCPFYKGKYRAEKCRTPVAAEILKRVINAGLIEVKPSAVRRRCAAIRRVIKRMQQG